MEELQSISNQEQYYLDKINSLENKREEIVKNIVKEEMEGAVNLKVPLDVDISEGSTWYDAK